MEKVDYKSMIENITQSINVSKQKGTGGIDNQQFTAIADSIAQKIKKSKEEGAGGMDKEKMHAIIEEFKKNISKTSQGENPGEEAKKAVIEMLTQFSQLGGNPENKK